MRTAWPQVQRQAGREVALRATWVLATSAGIVGAMMLGACGGGYADPRAAAAQEAGPDGHRDCTAGELRISDLPAGAAGGHGWDIYALTNTGTTSCTIYRAVPTLREVGTQTGADLTTYMTDPNEESPGTTSPATDVSIAPGEIASFYVDYQRCTGSYTGEGTRATLIVIIPGLRRDLTIDEGLVGGCSKEPIFVSAITGGLVSIPGLVTATSGTPGIPPSEPPPAKTPGQQP